MISPVCSLCVDKASLADILTGAFVDLSIWVCVENNVVIMAASIPTLRPIMRRKSVTAGNSLIAERNHSERSDKICSSDGERALATTLKISRRDSYATWLSSKLHGHSQQSGHRTSIAGTALCNGSEEYALRPRGEQAITKTTDVRVAYETQASADVSLNSNIGNDKV